MAGRMGDRLKFQGWICVACERPFTRRWNANRHAAEQHLGQSAQIVTLIEYLAGRQSGIYQYQSPSQTQSSAPPSARKSATNIHDILRIFESREKVEQNEQNGNNLVNEMTREFARELARQSAANYASKVQQQQQSRAMISSMYTMAPQSLSRSNSLIPTGNEADIFGFRGHICSKCLMMQHLAISYPTGEQIGATSEQIGRDEIKHECNPFLLANNQNLDQKVMDTSVELMRQNLPKYLKDVVNLWNRRDAYIAGIAGTELRSISLTTPPPNDNIKIPHPKDPKKSISFQYSMEKHVELQPNPGDGNPEHWSARVLQEGHTSLADNELQEFLNLVTNATFGIFNIHIHKKTDRKHQDQNQDQKQFLSETQIQQSPTRCYFMYLSRKE